MSVSIETVEFSRRDAFLSELEDGPPYTVHGVALGDGDVTVGQSGIKKLWPADELQKAADTLEGRNLVVDHNNSSDGVVGQVTKSGYKEGVGVLYEAELFDKDLADKISDGLLEVSIRGHHMDVDQMEENDDGAKIVEEIEFDNLSIVPTGASPSNTLEMGEAAELSASQIRDYTDTIDAAELQEIEPGMWVKWDDGRGITISQIEDGEVEVDVYEESDDKWRSTGETEMVSTDSLTEWDVDEEEDIGSREDEESDDSDEEEAQSDVPDEYSFESEEDAQDFIEGEDGLTGVHQMDDMWVPGDNHEEFVEWMDSREENSKHKMDPDEEDDEETEQEVDAPDFAEGMMVRWQVNPDMVGEVVHNPDDREIIMVDVMEREDGELQPTGHTLTAAPPDLMPMDSEEMERVESEEGVVGEDISEDDIKEQSPERYPDEPDEVEELQEWEFHSPDYSGTTESSWDSPDMEDFDTDDLSEIDDHFLISEAGFPPENFGELALPVVEPNGNLNLNALQAVKGGRGASAVDGLSSEMEDRIIEWVNNTASDEFDKDWEEARRRPQTIDDTGNEKNVKAVDTADIALDLINKYLRIEGKHERDSVDKMVGWLFGSTDLPPETLDDFRMAANAFLGEQGGVDSFDAVTIEQFRGWLLTRPSEQSDETPPIASPVHVLTGDDLRQRYKSEESELDSIQTTEEFSNMTEDIEEKLAELNEPVAVEESDLEELQQKADQFEELNSNIEELRERTEILDDVDREQVEELAESEEPVVVESTRYEELEAEAEQVKSIYAAALAEESAVLEEDELTERFSIEELRAKYEDQIGDPEEELSAEPRSADPSEEELEEAAEEENEDTEELSDDVQQKQQELKDKILSNVN